MRVMLDTNVLISALLFPGGRMSALMDIIFTQHELVLSLTGDKDFSDITIDRPTIMTPAEFLDSI